MMIITLEGGVQRYVDQLGPEARSIVEGALVTTLQSILGLRNGACYRYEAEIKRATEAVNKDYTRRLKERLDEGRY
jgi:hypothetical protein